MTQTLRATCALASPLDLQCGQFFMCIYRLDESFLEKSCLTNQDRQTQRRGILTLISVNCGSAL